MNDAESYKELNHHEHIYLYPDTYIGAINPREREEYALIDNTIRTINVDFPENLIILYLEILSNASDNVQYSRERNINPGIIQIFMDDTIVQIQNNGIAIPIEQNANSIYVPQMIFGTLLTSYNYDREDKRVRGKNGYGAKLTNIFSKLFKIDIFNKVQKLRYRQTWRNNMKEMEDPIIEKFNNNGDSYVKVTYQLDFQRFGLEKYTNEIKAICERIAIDTAFASKVQVNFNDDEINIQSIVDYARLYFGEIPTESLIVHRTDNFEICIIDSPNEGRFVTLVNGAATSEGGSHVDETYRAILPFFLEGLDISGTRVQINDIKAHVSLIGSFVVLDPQYSSQTKTRLTNKLNKNFINFPKDKMTKIQNWKAKEQIRMKIEGRQLNKLKKLTDGKKERHINVPKVDDANNAGTSQSELCTLFLVEGDSAKAAARSICNNLHGGHDYYGIYPLRGKFINVRNLTIEELFTPSENDADSEIKNEPLDIKKCLGLQEGRDYTNDDDFRTLRYGSVCILADADEDGTHIAGLIINFFEKFYPTLLMRKKSDEKRFLKILRSPLYRVYRGKSLIFNFFSELELNEWKQNNNNGKGYRIRQYKGLGSSSPMEIQKDMENPRFVSFDYDLERDQIKLQLAFDINMIENRKEWILDYCRKTADELLEKEREISNKKLLNISEFIDWELPRYEKENLLRSLPNIYDGLKISQRKILWTFLNYDNEKKNGVKIAVAASDTTTKTYYFHGQQCLEKAIINMTQDFTGANNVEYFAPGGQIGTRIDGGKDHASSRYVSISSSDWLEFIFMKEDLNDQIINFGVDDKDKNLENADANEKSKTSPIYLAPIIPLHLCNGSSGIGSGFSSNIPNYNPKDICELLKCRLQKREDTVELIPWFKNFQGRIEVIDDDNVRSVFSYGTFKMKDANTIIITELPIGVWVTDYINRIRCEFKEKGIFKDIRNNCDGDTNRIELTIILNKNHEFVPSELSLHLRSKISITNMTCLDENGKVERYETSYDLFNDYYRKRVKIYEKRRQYKIHELENEIDKDSRKMKLINDLISKTITDDNRRSEEVFQALKERGHDIELYKKLRSIDRHEDNVNQLQARINEKTLKLHELENETAENLWLKDIEKLQEKFPRVFGKKE